jgi:hypothetical protein
MISARGPDSASADELGIDVRAPWFASLARLPDRSTPCRPASAEASNPLLAPRPIPSGIGMTKPTMQQARDRAEVVSGATRPERVVCHERRLSTTVRNCTRDEGGPFEVGNQVLISSHRKLLSSKAMGERCGNAGTRFRQAKASASEPSMKCRKRIRRCQNRG